MAGSDAAGAARDAATLRAAQVVLILPLALCAVLDPRVATSEGGISNFGNHVATVPLYALAFAGNALLTLGALSRLGRALARSLVVACSLELVVLASTFVRRFSFTWSYVHDYLGVAQFVAELVVSVLVVARRPGALAFGLVAVQVGGSLAGLGSALKVVHLLFWGQVVGSLGYAGMIGLVLAGGLARDARRPARGGP